MSIGNVLRIPHFLSAKSPRRLQQLMLEQNTKDGMEYTYQDIIFSDGKWWAWFYKEAKPVYLLNKQTGKINGDISGSS
jgi:hypothetical protein